MRFGMFDLAEFMNTITMSAIIVTLFLGGPAGPIGPGPEQLWPFFWFTVKLLAFLFAFVWVRATLPRFRYDQLMDLGWKRLIPLSLGWLLLVASLRVADDQGWDRFLVVGIAFALGLAAAFLMMGAIRVADINRERVDA